MTNAQRQIFVSYSRRDAELIGPIVKLLRTTGTKIFRDEDSIEPGEEWRVAISESIEDARSVLVFWCEHSSESTEVRREWRQAVDAGKRVIPVMLDETPLDEVLARFNGIPLQGVVRHRASEPPPTAPSPPSPGLDVLRRKGAPGMKGTAPTPPGERPELTPTVAAPMTKTSPQMLRANGRRSPRIVRKLNQTDSVQITATVQGSASAVPSRYEPS